MNKSIIVVVVLVVLAVGGVAVAMQLGKDPDSAMTGMSDMGKSDKGSSNSMSTSEQDLTSQKEVTMDIKDFDFEKANITIKVGTKVTWTNVDSARHNVVIDGEGEEGLGSELLAKGESYSYTFMKAGMTNYLCEPHPYMKGMINVVE
ncbi:MAG: plastocyanin/azurin family copper-binding protein [Patescibacteria group bacterium]